tara:strand:- start:93432 stop:94217 length:786 start_codon:yes stop_codon:yes gene_type:complete
MNFLVSKIKLFFTSSETGYYCPVCDQEDIHFIPLNEFYRENAEQHGYELFGMGEMTALATYECSECGASDRERIYTYWIEDALRTGRLGTQSKIIHFAPEAILSAKMKTLGLSHYSTADLMMDHVDFNVDLMQLAFEDHSFDFFICSHVLEHVESDDRAIQELYRILKPGGCGILMAPVNLGLESTVEDPAITTEAGRWKHFGQGDHVRLYAHDDYVKKIGKYGFKVLELGEEYFGSELFRQLGLKPTSILYIVEKDDTCN